MCLGREAEESEERREDRVTNSDCDRFCQERMRLVTFLLLASVTMNERIIAQTPSIQSIVNLNEGSVTRDIVIDSVQSCLQKSLSLPIECNVWQVQCHINQKDCLKVAVPPNTYSYHNIKCCLWCCLKYFANGVHTNLKQFIFTPEGLGIPRKVLLSKKTNLKKTKFSFFQLKTGSLDALPESPQPHAVVVVSTNKAAEYEYEHSEMASADKALAKLPWALRLFTPSCLSNSANIYALRSGVYFLPRGVTNVTAAEEAAILYNNRTVNGFTERHIDILCLVEPGVSQAKDLPLYFSLGYQCNSIPMNISEYYEMLHFAKFVLILQQVSPDRPRVLNTKHPYWVYDAIFSGSVPILGPMIARSVVNFLQSASAPFVLLTKDDLTLLKRQDNALNMQYILRKYQNYASTRSLSVSFLYFPFWLDILADISRTGPVAPASLLESSDRNNMHKTRQHNSRARSQSSNAPFLRKRLPLSSGIPVKVECSPGMWPSYSAADSGSVYNLEVVIPRCCEPVESLEWLKKLMVLMPHLIATIYYRCPYCLPRSKATEWLQLINLNPVLQRSIQQANGGAIIDNFWDDNKSGGLQRIKEVPLYDTVSNGKEFVPFLHHIVHSYKALSEFTIFLHTTPFDHIKSSTIFDRSLSYLGKCKPDGSVPAFWFVNQRMFEGNFWSNCHGCTGCLYHYWVSFIDANMSLQEFVSMPKRAYNAAQFIASKKSILSREWVWWDRMLAVTNNSLQDLKKCPLPKEWNDGGNQAGLALERMWHVIFNRPPQLPYRKNDETLPPALRFE